MLVSGIDPCILPRMLSSNQRAGEQSNTPPLPHAQRMRSAAAAGQSCFLQHSDAIVWLGSGACHPHQAGTVGTSAAQMTR